MAFDLSKLPEKLDLGAMSDTWYLAAEHGETEKSVLGRFYKDARVYVTGKYTEKGFKFELFPHIIVDNGGTDGAGRVHYSHAAGRYAHTNPHIWGYEKGDALFVDNFAEAQSGYKTHCQLLSDFMSQALKITIKVSKRREGGVGGRWVNIT